MVTLEEIRAKHKQLVEEKENKGGGEFGNSYAKFELGDNLIRFLPGKSEPLSFYVEGAIHKITGADGKKSNFQCRKPQGEECPVCDFVNTLWDRHKALKLGKDKDGKQIKSKYGTMAGKVKAQPRYYAMAVIRKLEEKGEDPVKYVVMDKALFTCVISAFTNNELYDEDDPENTTIISLDRGNDFNVRMDKQGEFHTFASSQSKFKKTKAGSPAKIAEWMETKLDPRSLVKIGDYDEAKKIVAQLEASLNTVTEVNSPDSASPFKTEDDDSNENKFNQKVKV